jgi:L-threonylcarbamoyladenylate synthase
MHMIRVFVDPRHPDPVAIARAGAIIRGGGIVAYSTDTLYGLAADPRDSRAVARLFTVKDRPPERAIPLIASDEGAAVQAGPLTARDRMLARYFWPGPLTLLVRADGRLAPPVHSDSGLVGVRVPDSVVARALAVAAGGLITATSANRSGAAATADPADLQPLADRGLDALLDAGPAPGGLPSTIVDVSADPPRLVRAGAVPWERVLEFLDRRSS